jgi:hypothetical protein
MTLGELQYTFMLWQAKFQVSREAADVMVALLKRCLKHVPNIVPTSWYLMQASTSAAGKPKTWQDYQRHACLRKKCQGHAWRALHPRDWHKAATIPPDQGGGDKCPHCQGDRFKVVYAAGGCSGLAR